MNDFSIFKFIFSFVILLISYTSIISDSKKSPFALVEIEENKSAKKIRNCSIKVNYPSLKNKINGNVSANVLNKVNKFLKKEFLDIKRYDNEFECNRNAAKSDPSFYLEIKYNVKHNEGTLISFYYYAVGYLSGAPHPNNQYKGFTFDLRNGENIDFDDLFIQGTNYLLILNSKIIESLIAIGVISIEDEFEELKKNRYDFYITKGNIHIINLYEIHAMQSVEASIPIKKLKKVINNEKISF